MFYVATFKEAVYVLHAFHKATQKTPIRDLNLGRQRFRDLVAMRQTRDAKRHT